MTQTIDEIKIVRRDQRVNEEESDECLSLLATEST